MTSQQLYMLRSLITQYWGLRAEEVLAEYTWAHLGPLWGELLWASLRRYGFMVPNPPSLEELLTHSAAILEEEQQMVARCQQQVAQESLA